MLTQQKYFLKRRINKNIIRRIVKVREVTNKPTEKNSKKSSSGRGKVSQGKGGSRRGTKEPRGKKIIVLK